MCTQYFFVTLHSNWPLRWKALTKNLTRKKPKCIRGKLQSGHIYRGVCNLSVGVLKFQSMRYRGIILFMVLTGVVALLALMSCSKINTVGDPHFEEDGTLIVDSQEALDSVESVKPISFAPQKPSKIKFYVEVSGSMNGFFRPNRPTEFKADVWQIISYYSAIIPEITTLTNEGDMGASVSLSNFQTMMNTGAFVSSASTKVPIMLQSIINNLNTEAGEVAVLVSDMKYSPVGAAAPEVLLTQYSTDISRILGTSQKAVCLVGATSNYLDKSGSVVCDKSPYYFLIIGDGMQVADMRNGISTLLENNGRYIDNIESGFDYGAPTYSFGIPDNCFQMDEENPTFCGFDSSVSDTCMVKLKVNLENYRWIVANDQYFEKAFQYKALYGSNVKMGKVEYEIQNITDKELRRKATAIVELKVYDMAMDSEVIEWSLALPDTDVTLFTPYFGATTESDVTKSYSVDNFIKGIFYGGVVNKTLKPNYILISKNS